MTNIKVDYIAFPSAAKDVFKRGEEIIKKALPDFNIVCSDKEPEILFVLTGGSESQAKKIHNNVSFILILAMNENNGFAAASEIKAYCNQNNIRSIVLNIDTEENLQSKIEQYIRLYKAIQNIKKYTLGLLGNISEWLIASDVQNNVLENKFGIHIKKIDWKTIPEFSKFPVNNSFITHFKNSDTFDLSDSSKVYNLLLSIIQVNQLDAITVECFPMVREHAVTACLALSKLNTDIFPAGCEGDLTSITGMIIAKELTGKIPWMANLVSIAKNSVFFAHCTIATNLVSDYKISTHFETNLGTAVQGQFSGSEVTIFRFDKSFEQAFIAHGEVISKPNKNDACRTQIEVELPKNAIELLKENPLGNHHLVLPGKHSEILDFFCKSTQIMVH